MKCIASRSDFPILHRNIDGKPLIYFDNAATTQKPQSVINALTEYYSSYNANVHRGIHTLSEESTTLYELARQKVADYIGASSPQSIAFTKNATESINAIASAWGERHIHQGDEILLSVMEHHSNIVPWQQLALRKEAQIHYIPITDQGIPDFEIFCQLVTPRTKILALSGCSNVLGMPYDISPFIRYAHDHGVVILIDACQLVASSILSVQDIDCDFCVFSGHKMYGPMGIGVTYMHPRMFDQIDPFLTGGGMISKVDDYRSTWAEFPAFFEAGTPPVADAYALGAAIDFLNTFPVNEYRSHITDLTEYAYDRWAQLPYIHLVSPRRSLGILSFRYEGVHPHDVAQILADNGIAVRAGHHCCQPLMRHFEVPALTRASFACYNTREEIDIATEILKEIHGIFTT